MDPYMPTRTLACVTFTFCGSDVHKVAKGEKVSKPWHWQEMKPEDQEGYVLCDVCEQHWQRHQAVGREEKPPGHCTCHFCKNPPDLSFLNR